MGTGIIVCGLNGAGKSTMGKALAERLNYHFIDVEDLYFPKTDDHYTYASPRTREAVYPFFRFAVVINVPKEIRMQRVKNRSFQKFGSRMLPGGDLYEKEKGFFDLVESRSEEMVEKWIQRLSCPIIRVDGTKPIGENVKLIAAQIK